MSKSLPSSGGLASGRAGMEQLLKQVLGPLEKKGERELQRFSKRLQKCLVREGEKLIAQDTPEGGAEPAAGINDRGDSAEHDGQEVAVKVLTDPDRIRDLAEALGTDVPPVQSEPLPAGATAGAAESPPIVIPDSEQLEILPLDNAERHTVVLRSPEVSEIFQSQPLVEGSHVAFSCFVAGYFPQELTVTWLRRESGDSVATPIEDSADYAIIHKETCAKDRETYQQMVTLSFTPSAQRDQGAEFICQVGHVALQTPIERSTGTLEVKGVATPDAKEVAPNTREVTPVFKEVTPNMREVTPVFKEVAPVSRKVTPIFKEVAPVSRKVTAVSKEVTPDSREFKPISREDRGSTAGRKGERQALMGKVFI
uniref:Ig-like domain-containing protein n=1 Tax=Terrapene triunguis TaxID=2587831 RepID=A0A674IXM2_9SAUR